MASASIAHSLPYINWVLLFSLSAGTAAAVVLGRLFSDATRGYLVFMSATAVVFGSVAVLMDLSLPSGDGLAVSVQPEIDGPRRLALELFVILCALYMVVVARGRRAPLLGAAVLVVAVATGTLAALGWSSNIAAGVPVGVLFLVLAAAGGGTFAAMVLGHWYLVTPRLSEAPLVGATRLLIWVLVLQLLLFVIWTGFGMGADGRPFGPLLGPNAVFAWLLLVIGLVFPLAVMAMANRTARSRSMESATGLLYLATAAVLAATIVSAALYFGAGLLV